MSILFDTQKQVVDILKEDAELSAVTILAENSRDIDYEISEALGKQGLVAVVMTPAANYIGNYEDKMIAWEIDELTIQVVENVSVNRGKKDGVLTGQDVAMRITDWLSSPKYGRQGTFSPIGYEQGEDGNLLVNKVVFKCAVYENKEEEEEEEYDIGVPIADWDVNLYGLIECDFEVEGANRTQKLVFREYYTASGGKLSIDWGDGVVQNISKSYEYQLDTYLYTATHTYSTSVKSAEIKVYYYPANTNESYIEINSNSFTANNKALKKFRSKFRYVDTSNSPKFQDCTNLVIFENQTFIGPKSKFFNGHFFANCINLEYVDIHEGNKHVKLVVDFLNCRKLKYLKPSIIDCTDNTVMTFSNLSSFCNCGDNIESLTLIDNSLADGTLSEIRDYSFANAGIKDLTISSTSSKEQFIIASMQPFYNTQLKKIKFDLPNIDVIDFQLDFIKTDDDNPLFGFMFANNKELETIEYNGVLKFSSEDTLAPFYNCKKLKKLPPVIFEDTNCCAAFADCEQLEEVDITKKSSSTITNGIFQNCYNLKKVILRGYPLSITSGGNIGAGYGFIARYPFVNCLNLKTIIYKDLIGNSSGVVSIPSLNFTYLTKSFIDINKITIVVPDDLYDKWITATNWSTIADRIIKASDYEAQQEG